jgi:hypothetical protein
MLGEDGMTGLSAVIKGRLTADSGVCLVRVPEAEYVFVALLR